MTDNDIRRAAHINAERLVPKADHRTDLREKVAKVLCNTEWGDGIWEKPGLLSRMEQDAYYALADAALSVALEEAARVAEKWANQQANARNLECETTPEWQVYNQGVFIASNLAAAIRALIPIAPEGNSNER